MNDMSSVITAKSDQLNADDLMGGPRTITITRVEVRDGGEQPVSVYFEGDNGKPWKPCKSMARVLVNVWGVKPETYVGRALTLWRDPSVKWAGMEVGGLRITHMSDLQSERQIALTVTKGNKKMTTVKPLSAAGRPPPPPASPPPPPKQTDEPKPDGFPFTVINSAGQELVFKGDGAKWRDTLIAWMSKAFDRAASVWESNEVYVDVAEEAGHIEFTKPVRDHWKMREAASKNTAAGG